ncbi:putative tpr repeat protein oca3 protein [Botrytis cinerea BcDW1]|uniref:Putative tpr repeat protein oca3 protein n=1 Tax=Botryotinia fuckeliana (strain BcDW1) TaxID=1290391 RepID=M7U3W7_BOTF1|nr:putative tpr repeat protein oca3 protein [Botrytis cinerea BcDW1]
MARIAVDSNGDNPPDANSLPNPPRFNVELPPISCFIEDKNGSPTRKFFTTPDELTNHLERTTHHKERKLYVLEGLPIEYVQVLGLHFNIDVDIFDSHAMRKSGQLNKLEFPTKIGNEKKVRTFALDHPEITTNITPPPEASGGVAGDFMIPLLLLLENQSWARRGAQFQTAGYHSILANALKSLPEGKQKWKPSRKHDPALTLADEIFNSIELPGGILAWDDLTEILADIVLRQWKFALGEVIEHACASRSIPYHEIHQVCDLIESNIWTLDRTEALWGPHYVVRVEGFKRLLKKAKRYAHLFVWGQIVEEGLETKAKNESATDNEDDDDTSSSASSKSGVHIRGGETLDLETRQSINRVTYLGGVLLPFSIIAAIFSMGGNFQPGGDQFFIFWVIAIPVCMLTTVLIYADSIRRMTLEQFAQQYGSDAVTAEADDMVTSSISGSEIISYKVGIKERLRSRIPGVWNSRRAGSSSSVGYTDSDDNSSSTDSTQLPPGLSIDGDLLVRRKRKKVSRSWIWRFWRRKPLGRKSDPENVLPSPRHSDHNVSSPSAPPPTSPPSAFHPIRSSPQITPVKPIPVGNDRPESLTSDNSPTARPAPPETPPASPPLPDPDLSIPDQIIPEPIVLDPGWNLGGTPSKISKKGKKRRQRRIGYPNDEFDIPTRPNPATSPPHPSTPDPAGIPLPPLDSDSDDWRERDSSEGIHPERSPSPGRADSDYATDRERRSLERRMRENDDRALTRRGSREYLGIGDEYERIVEREIIYRRRRRSEHSVKSERKHVIEKTTEKLVEEQERKHATDDIMKDDDDVPEDRGRQRRRSTVRWAHRGTYYDYPRRPTPNTDPTEIPLPPSPEELSEEERIRTKLEREKLEYLEKLKQKERHRRMAEMEEEHAKKRAEEEYARRIAEEEYKKKAAESRAAKGKDRAYSPVESDNKGLKPAIKFKDAVGRKFMFPFHLVSTWAGMEELVKQAFLHVDVIGPHVNEGRYDLLGPTGEIILPQVWESVIEPGWLITMHMWPMPEPRRQAPAPMPPKPGHPGNFPPPPPPPGFTAPQPGGLISGPTPRMKKSTQTGAWDWVEGARHSKSRKKQKSAPIRLGPPLPPSFPRPPPPPPASGRRESDTVVIIEDLPPKVHRRQTGMSDRHRHGASGGGIIGGAAKPNEELGWVRALGTIVGVKPGIQVKKRSGGSSSSSSV